jgi:hypothetical protein
MLSTRLWATRPKEPRLHTCLYASEKNALGNRNIPDTRSNIVRANLWNTGKRCPESHLIYKDAGPESGQFALNVQRIETKPLASNHLPNGGTQ